MNNLLKKAGKYLVSKGCVSLEQQYTAFEIKKNAC